MAQLKVEKALGKCFLGWQEVPLHLPGADFEAVSLLRLAETFCLCRREHMEKNRKS